MANAWAARIVPMLDFIARAICSKTSPDLRRQRTSAAIVLYLAMKGTVGLCRLWSAIRAGGLLALRCTARALLIASVLMPSVRLADRQWAVGMHRHAMERLCERLRTTPSPTNTQYVILWISLSTKIWKYEPIELNDGQQALRVLTYVHPNEAGTKWHNVYVKQPLRSQNQEHGQRR